MTKFIVVIAMEKLIYNCLFFFKLECCDDWYLNVIEHLYVYKYFNDIFGWFSSSHYLLVDSHRRGCIKTHLKGFFVQLIWRSIHLSISSQFAELWRQIRKSQSFRYSQTDWFIHDLFLFSHHVFWALYLSH